MARTNGVVIIGTKFDTSGFEKGISDLEKKAEKKKTEIEIKTKGIEQAKKELEELEKQRDEIVKKYEEVIAIQGRVQELENKTPDERTSKENSELMSYSLLNTEKILESTDKEWENIAKKIEKAKDNITSQNSSLADQQEQYQKILDKVEEIRAKEKQSRIDQVAKEIGGIKSGIRDIVKNVGRWAVSIMGVGSAYMIIRQAMSTLSQYSQDLANTLSSIKLVIAAALEPAVNRIVSLIVTLLNYLNYLTKAWFNLDLFARASELASKNMASNMGSAAKSAKDMKKQLAGFDEMNVLQDTSASSSGGGVGTATATNPFNLEEVEIPEWLKWIAEHGEEIATVLGTIGVILAGLKLANLLKTLGLFSGLPLWQLVLGLALIISGIALAIKGVIDFIKDPSWENFLTILQGVAMVVAGIALLMGAWVVALIALGVAIVAYVIKNWDKVKEILGKVGSWIYDHIIKPVKGFFDGLWGGIVGGFTLAWEKIKNFFKNIPVFFASIISTITGFFRSLGTKAGDVIGSAFKAVVNGVLKAIENILNFPIRQINSLIGVINKIPGINLGKLSTFKLPRLAKGTIVNAPGKGVLTPSGTAYYGEAGPEAYLPLSDTQLLEQLGSTIGKYININATIPVQIGNRVVAREIKRINVENDFAFNR